MYFDADRWRILMDIKKKQYSPKEYGISVCSKKNKMRGGAKRK